MPLPAGERVATLSDHRVVTLRELADEAVRRRDHRGADDVRLSRIGIQRDVLADGRREQEALLEHDRHVSAERDRVRVAHIDASDQDPALLGIRQPYEQLCQRRLADAGRAHDRDRFHRLDVERDAIEDRHAVVEVAHPEDLDPQGSLRQLLGVFRRVQRDAGAEHFFQPGIPHDRSRQLREDPADEPHRP